jgi:hypothetical protein
MIPSTGDSYFDSDIFTSWYLMHVTVFAQIKSLLKCKEL